MIATGFWKWLRTFIGLPHASYHANEQVVAALGGMLGILLILLVTGSILGQQTALLIVPSLGATAVLVFAVPHSPLTQPWAVLGGHLVSALIGVSCYKLIPVPMLAAALAVGLAIAGMHLTRCIHPPGGATALTAVIGGTSVHSLGYFYALTPIAINCLIILIIGFLFNYAFPWRRYPASLMRYAAHGKRMDVWPSISEAQIEEAIDRLNVVVDISTAELGQIIDQAMQVARKADGKAQAEARLGHIYCNDRSGPQWSVRQIVDERPSTNPEFDLVIYEILEGSGKGRFDSCPRQEFARWIGSELKPERSR